MGPFWKAVSLAGALAALAGCSGGGGTTKSEPPIPGVYWTANREHGVNSPGGGYIVDISGRVAGLEVPYVSGSLAPTSITTTLPPGNYTITIRAYAALNDAGGTSRKVSLPSQTLSVTVP